MTEISKKKLGKFSVKLSFAVLILSVLFFWGGLNFLRSEVFTHYYNPNKHVIVSQNQDTKEIYSWQDAQGNVYTPEDAQVNNFTWGSTGLLLLTMLLGIGVQRFGIKVYTKTLIPKYEALYLQYKGGE
ncbi:hypothetical protein Desor_4753 [Desulfosporosinus orientis DSM 765]|uniref:Uncharacterized protein n=1 Tax=Desulfosporosinus orientis (strain ATCC 19365 / DSM 765 / NCIMB 8382 / VKM B-1628 / Singapore I) TaxID=768706 RepID=G7WG63_DESOD|nr:hypothetical protein [Desulfosporosinus orientis]AET70157.1 hypothetical protein Desor_4753 [Desulfosporosinus orientis DSM 765]